MRILSKSAQSSNENACSDPNDCKAAPCGKPSQAKTVGLVVCVLTLSMAFWVDVIINICPPSRARNTLLLDVPSD